MLPAVPKQAIPGPAGGATTRGYLVTLPLAARERLYGFGLQFFSVEHRGKKRVMRVNADPKVDTGDSHAPVPFYVSSHGYGVLIDTARYATFYCGNAKPEPSKAMKGPEGGLDPLYEQTLMEGENSTVLVEVPIAAGVDVYLFAGPTPLDVVRRYNLFSGGGVCPPEWGLGFWYRAESRATSDAVVALGRQFRDRGIPCDVVGLEPGWQSHSYSCSFLWSPERFPEPKSFLAKMEADGYRVNLWEHAFTHPSSPLFDSLTGCHGSKAVWGGIVPDFHGAPARNAFGDFHGRSLIDLGISGFKLDECDNSDFTGGWSFPELSTFPSGVDGEQMHSLFGRHYQTALWQEFKARDKPTYGLVRSSGALAAPYPFVLYSDLYDHRQFVRALVNSSFSGLLWCPEVRDAKSVEDLVRRLQTAVFSPLCMVNGWYIKNPPWKQLDRHLNNEDHIDPEWENVEARCREIIEERMRLIPYLLAAFERYAKDGTPPFRALTLDWPDDVELAEIDDAWMVGDRMLVAPLFAGELSRKVHLPPGNWHDYWTGEPRAGSTVYEVHSDSRQIPVFVKSGAIMPRATVTRSTRERGRRSLDAIVYGDGSLPFEVQLPSGEHLRCEWDGALKQGRSLSHGGPEPFHVQSWSHYA